MTNRHLSCMLLLIALLGIANGLPLHVKTTKSTSIETTSKMNGIVPLERAYAHNDQENGIPLEDSMNNYFCNIETDVFLINGSIYSGHDRIDLKGLFTELYLDPLSDIFVANGGKYIYGQSTSKLRLCETMALLVDVKSDAQETYDVLHQILSSYVSIYPGFINVYSYGSLVSTGAVEVMISGSRVSPEYLSEQQIRYVTYDGRIYEDVDDDTYQNNHVISWVSQNWNSVFTSRQTPFTNETCDEIGRIVSIAHSRDQKVRFWNIPESEEFWGELIRCGADIINCDTYNLLNEYLLS